MAGVKGRSGRKSAGIERKSFKVEALALDYALEIFNTGTPGQKFELTKTIAPKVISQIREHKSESGPRKITIEFVRRGEIEQQEPKAPVCIDITPESRTQSPQDERKEIALGPTITREAFAEEENSQPSSQPLIDLDAETDVPL